MKKLKCAAITAGVIAGLTGVFASSAQAHHAKEYNSVATCSADGQEIAFTPVVVGSPKAKSYPTETISGIAQKLLSSIVNQHKAQDIANPTPAVREQFQQAILDSVTALEPNAPVPTDIASIMIAMDPHSSGHAPAIQALIPDDLTVTGKSCTPSAP